MKYKLHKMPFTFCHPAIVFLFRVFPKRYFSLIGLIIGSMAPDFEYFLRMRISSTIGHSLHGMFLFDLPLGLLFAHVFFNTVSEDLIHNLPKYFRDRLLFITKFDWNESYKENRLVVMYSIVLGAATHILWDGFTHKSGYFVLQYGFLSSYINIFSCSVGVYKILQHASTLISGVFLLLLISKLKPEERLEQKNISIYWVRVIIIGFCIAFFRIILGGFGGIGTFIVTCIAAGLYALILTPLIFRQKLS